MHKEVVCTVNINITNMENLFFLLARPINYCTVNLDVYVLILTMIYFVSFLIIYFNLYVYKYIAFITNL